MTILPAVVDGMMNCDVSLEADRDRHQDGAGHGHHQQRVQEVRKENNVLKSKLEIIPNIVYLGKYLSNLVSHGLLKELIILEYANRFIRLDKLNKCYKSKNFLFHVKTS